MKVQASIDHRGATEVSSISADVAAFLSEKLAEWAAGRRGGKFTIAQDNATTEVWFDDITRFELRVEA